MPDVPDEVEVDEAALDDEPFSTPSAPDSGTVGVENAAEGDGDDALQAAEAAVEADIAAVAAERDQYLLLAQRLQAEFENYKKQSIKRNTDLIERAGGQLVEKLLPVLDAFDAALTHGHDDLKPIYETFMDVLEKEGLTLVYPAGEAFDPNLHDAVMHEPDEAGDVAEPTVVEVLRSGYQWRGRVLRPAMVKVKG